MTYKADSILRNHMFNFLIQILNIIFPLISIPYISRIFGPDILGKVNFANSIVQYFIMFASLGIPLYAVREVARVRNDYRKLIKISKGITLLQIITTTISFIMFIIFINTSHITNDDTKLYLLLGIQIISNGFNFVWFIQGIEKYKYITVTNLVVKFINILLIFFLLRSKHDYYNYALIISFCSLFTSFLNTIVYVKILINFDTNNYKISLSLKDMKFHLCNTLTFFLSNIAVNIYTSMDQTMLGLMSGSIEVGYYYMSIRIVKIILSFVTSISIIMMPRVSNSIENGSIDVVKKYMNLSINLVYIIAIPFIFGIFAIGEELLLFYLGNDFIESIFIFKSISILLVIIGLSNVFGMQFMIPYGMEKKFTVILVIAAIINFLLNLVLIPLISYRGAIISTIMAEFIVTYLMYIEFKKKFGQINDRKSLYKIIISSFAFYIFIVLFIKPRISSNIFTIVVSLVISPIIYFSMLVILKDKLVLYFVKKLENIFCKK